MSNANSQSHWAQLESSGQKRGVGWEPTSNYVGPSVDSSQRKVEMGTGGGKPGGQPASCGMFEEEVPEEPSSPSKKRKDEGPEKNWGGHKAPGGAVGWGERPDQHLSWRRVDVAQFSGAPFRPWSAEERGWKERGALGWQDNQYRSPFPPRAKPDSPSPVSINKKLRSFEAWQESDRKEAKEKGVEVKEGEGEAVPAPWVSFQGLFGEKVDETLIKKFGSSGSPTPIQSFCWPLALSGRDLVGISQTGSGKTLSFLLPALAHLQHNPYRGTPGMTGQAEGIMCLGCLVLSPTRELAQQIYLEADTFSPAFLRPQEEGGRWDRGRGRMWPLCTVGGEEKAKQIRDLRNRDYPVYLVVGTPGRLRDLEEDGALDLANVSFLVLDEADQMLDFGFEGEVTALSGNCLPPRLRQTVMFSATWKKAVEKVAEKVFGSAQPTQIKVQKLDPESDESDEAKRADLVPCRDIEQHFVFLESEDSGERLHSLVSIISHFFQTQQALGDQGKVIVFCERRDEVDSVSESLEGSFSSLGLAKLHGKMKQGQRNANADWFRNKPDAHVMISTSVLGRGMDFPSVKLVVNFSAPHDSEMYVHRIGRTGRAGRKGAAVTLLAPSEGWVAGDLIKIMEAGGQEVPAKLREMGRAFQEEEARKSGGGWWRGQELATGGVWGRREAEKPMKDGWWRDVKDGWTEEKGWDAKVEQPEQQDSWDDWNDATC